MTSDFILLYGQDYSAAISAAMLSSQERMASKVFFHQRIQLPAQALSTGDNHIPGAAGSELLVLELFLMLLSSMSCTLLLGRMRAAAPDEPL